MAFFVNDNLAFFNHHFDFYFGRLATAIVKLGLFIIPIAGFLVKRERKDINKKKKPRKEEE